MKKLLNKKGSVLFLVVVVMSILLVVASATYYIVSNQRQSVEVHYNSEQSYQTAYSVSQTVENYLTQVHNQISKGASYEDTIFGKIKELSVGGTMNATKDLKELGLGKFEVTIKKTDENADGDEMSFEVTTTSTVDGETSTLVQVWKVKLSAADTKYFTRFLTSTGLGTGTDTFLQVQQIFGENYFENEFTTIKDPTIQHRSIYSTGTFIDAGMSYDENFEDKELVVAGNLYFDGQSRTMIAKRLLVGGNLELRRQVSLQDNKAKTPYILPVYVLGDLVIKNGVDFDTGNNKIVFFVQGNCNIDCGNLNGNCEFYVNKNVDFKVNNCNAQVKIRYKENLNDINNKLSGKDVVQAAVDFNEEMNKIPDNEFTNGWTDVANYISNNTAVGTYKTWNALAFFEEGGKFYNAPAFNAAQEIDKAISANTGESKYYIQNSAPVAPGSSEKKSYIQYTNDSAMLTIGESCKYIRPTYTPNNRGKFAIMIDASESDIYIYLDPNNSDVFTFYENPSSMNVLVKGSHSVIFVLPENITFKMTTNEFIGHYELAKKIAGKDLSYFDDITKLYLCNGTGDTLVSLFTPESSTNIMTYITEDDGSEYFCLDTSKFGGEPVHNNIFIVSRGQNDFDMTSETTLAGYVYAPKSTLDITASGNHMKFFGGLIVGGFRYDHQSGPLAFCEPYDEYNEHGANIVADLINETPSYGGDKDDIAPDKKTQSEITFEGYK